MLFLKTVFKWSYLEKSTCQSNLKLLFLFIKCWELHTWAQHLSLPPFLIQLLHNSYLFRNIYTHIYRYFHAYATYWVNLALLICTRVQDWPLGIGQHMRNPIMKKTDSPSQQPLMNHSPSSRDGPIQNFSCPCWLICDVISMLIFFTGTFPLSPQTS